MTNVERYLTAVIVDDEEKAITNLKKLLGIYCPLIKVLGTAVGSDAAIIIINDLKPDVVFLDIAMPKRDGFETLTHLNIMPLIVFVTAHDKYALNAIKISAVDYLLKPVDIVELVKVEKKLLEVQAILKNSPTDIYSSILGALTNAFNTPEAINKITLYNTQGYHIVDIQEVLYLIGADNYTTFYLNSNKKLVIAKTLKEYEDLLCNMGFVRIHKSSIINMLHLKNINSNNGLQAIMSDGQGITVSRRRATNLLDQAKKFLA